MARVSGNLDLDGSTIKLNQGSATFQSLVAGTGGASGTSIRLPNTSEATQELVTAYSGSGSGDITKRVKFDTSGMTTGQTLTLSTSQSASQTLTLPVVSSGDSLVTNNTTATLTGKTLTNPKITAGGTIDTDVAGSLGIGTSTVTSLTVGHSGVTLTIGSTATRIPAAGSIDVASAGTMAIGTVNATNLSLGQAGQTLTLNAPTINLPVSAVLDGNGAISLGTTNATNITIGRTGQTVTLPGNLTVSGTTTTINTDVLNVEDANITINSGGTQATADANDAGLTVQMTDQTANAKIYYDSALASGWALDKGGSSSSPKQIVDVSSNQNLTNKTFDNTSNAVLVNGNTLGDILRIGTNDNQNVIIEANNSTRVTVRPAAAANADAKIHGTAGLELPAGNTAARPSTPVDGTVRYNSETLSFEGYKNSVWGALGGGSGQGGINYIANPDAEDTTTTGWETYADAAANVPVDGTGGSPNVTFTNTSSTPVRGTRSFLLTKDAANRQGQGASYAFTIDPADTSKQLTISMDYRTSSAYVANDLRMFVYDVTNATLIYPGVIDLPKFDTVGAAYTFKTSFVTTTSTSYRLILHVASTNASAYTLTLDNIQVGPQSLVQGTPVTEWQSYTPTIGGATSRSTTSFYYRRVGDNLEIQGGFTVSAGVGSAITVSIPAGLTIDTTKLIATSNASHVGTAMALDTGARFFDGIVHYLDNTTLRVWDTFNAGGNTWNASNPMTWASGDTFALRVTVPISQWAGSVVSIDNSQVEYASNNGTWDADTTASSVVYGPGGAVTGGSLSASRVKTVRFLTPIQPTDNVQLEISEDGLKWHEHQGYRHSTAGTITPLIGGNANNYGVALRRVSGSSTDVDVFFGQYLGPAATWDSAGRNWISGIYWRVSKSRNPLSVGGLTASKWQKKFLSGAVSATGDNTDLQFNNLEIGKTYRASGVLRHEIVGSGQGHNNITELRSASGGGGTAYLICRDVNAAPSVGYGNTDTFSQPINVMFTAVSSTLYVRLTASGVSRFLGGSEVSHITLEELPLHSQTSQWS
jgi:hypothetical protein